MHKYLKCHLERSETSAQRNIGDYKNMFQVMLVVKLIAKQQAMTFSNVVEVIKSTEDGKAVFVDIGSFDEIY